MSGGGRKRALHHEGDVDHVRVGEEDTSMKKETRFFMKNGTLARAGEEERAEAGARAAADGVEAEDALEAGAVVRELTDAVQRGPRLLADGDDGAADLSNRHTTKPGNDKARANGVYRGHLHRHWLEEYTCSA